MENHLKIFVTVLFLCVSSSMMSQKLEWNVDVNGFFDNSEGDHTYRPTKTMDGLRLTPEIGLSWDEGKNAIFGGYNALAEWGTKDAFTDGQAVVYYKYDWQPLRFFFGSFSRDNLLGEYPSYLICDSVRYYRPNIQGFTFQYEPKNGYLEMFLDWTGEQSKNEREQFMAGLSTEFNIGKFRLGLEGYYYHYALEANADSTQHIHGYLVSNPYIKCSYKNVFGLDSLRLKLGVLASFDRDRLHPPKWFPPIGFMGEVSGCWKRLFVKEMIYAGGSQQHFGSQGLGQYYWGDTYTQSHFYSRTDVSYQIIKSQYVDTYVALTFNATKHGVNCHQMVILRANLGTNARPRRWIRYTN